MGRFQAGSPQLKAAQSGTRPKTMFTFPSHRQSKESPAPCFARLHSSLLKIGSTGGSRRSYQARRAKNTLSCKGKSEGEWVMRIFARVFPDQGWRLCRPLDRTLHCSPSRGFLSESLKFAAGIIVDRTYIVASSVDSH